MQDKIFPEKKWYEFPIPKNGTLCKIIKTGDVIIIHEILENIDLDGKVECRFAYSNFSSDSSPDYLVEEVSPLLSLVL